MPNLFDTVGELTSGHLPDAERNLRLAEFTRQLGWRPADQLDVRGVQDITSAQLLVEHGLEHSAVLTFLRTPVQFPALGIDAQRRLLSASYNNLVDWHIAVEPDAINFAYARAQGNPLVERRTFTRDHYDNLRSEMFEEVVGKRPSANYPALDDALIKTISLWKRGLAGELPHVSNAELATLFNSIMFARALEDQHRRTSPSAERAILGELLTTAREPVPIRLVLARVIARFAARVPAFLFRDTDLAVFDSVSADTTHAMMSSFYDNRYAPYQYDFAVISQHALSRIYEHYVSLLRREDEEQLRLIPQLASEYAADRSQGAVYTPQFIARFFARFLREHSTPFQFKRLTVLDPACGSGIFLRTLLELQCDPTAGAVGPDLIATAFRNASGIDRDANAVAATELSLSLLHLVLCGTLPEELSITTSDYLLAGPSADPSAAGSRDVVIANPPFVAIGNQDAELRAAISAVVGTHGKGRLDIYSAFLKKGVETLKPGGFGLFVLPHSFLVGKSAKGLREFLAASCWIRCLADLSAIRVFGDTNVYVILLVLQKKARELSEPAATLIKCQDDVGHALQDAIEGKRVEGKYYSIYDGSQRTFDNADSWLILPPGEAAIRDRMSALPRLSELVEVKQGIVTGADDIFIVDAGRAPRDEAGTLFVPLLSDREMQAYVVPKRVSSRVFFPFFEGKKVDAITLRRQFPNTWNYLSQFKARLEQRKSLAAYKKEWWEPMWPREPGTIQRPKIVTPHLVVVPRFALDTKGRFGITRSPILVTKSAGDNTDMLKMLVGVLNSRACFWHIQRSSHVYGHGYTMLENRTLAKTPIPDLGSLGATTSRALVQLVDSRMLASTEDELFENERQLESMLADLYELTAAERRALAIETVS